MRERTLRRFEEWKADVNVPAMLVSRVAEGEALKAICAEQGIPHSLVAQWIAGSPGLKAQYDAALKIWADALAQETLEIVDGATPETVSVKKLQAEQRNKLAGKWDRERYGERDGGAVLVQVNLGNVGAEIRALEERLGLRGAPAALIEHEAVLPAASETADAGLI